MRENVLPHFQRIDVDQSVQTSAHQLGRGLSSRLMRCSPAAERAEVPERQCRRASMIRGVRPRPPMEGGVMRAQVQVGLRRGRGTVMLKPIHQVNVQFTGPGQRAPQGSEAEDMSKSGHQIGAEDVEGGMEGKTVRAHVVAEMR